MIRFQLISLTGLKFDDDVYEVILPTLDGQIGILPGHMPLTAVATIGVISVRRNSKDRDYKLEYFACNGGVIEVKNDVLKAIVGEADHASEINEQEAQKAFERAKEMKLNSKNQVSLEEANNLVDLLATKIKIAQLHKLQERR
ncbi:MAG TPA: ATP synthase F1 subunit epsilon [Candidatus Saccharimonadales bacterium]|jgi:F-type H+-transporting ATPase subunit epsilon|nr:ATP synthase F1 subunit epsilon [Candidatus Saccharimonadales bacterium]